MQLTTYCGCYSLRTGTICDGVGGIMRSGYFLIAILMTNVKWEIGLEIKVISAIYCCITILFCTLLIIGSIKKNAFMMLPWMVLSMMTTIVALVGIVYFAIVVIISSNLVSDLILFFFGLVAVMIRMYLWLVMYSHFQELRIESRNCAKERISTVNRIIIDDGDSARPRERSDPTSAISFI